MDTHVKPVVYESLSSKSLFFSTQDVQSKMDLLQPDALQFEYTRIMMGFLLHQPQPRRIAMLGLGGGSLAKFCYRYLPDADITVVEINPHVIARRSDFLVPADDQRFRVVQVDAADFVRTIETRQGSQIAALEEIAFNEGWIDRETLLQSAQRYGKSPYGQHLMHVAEGKIRY